MSIHRYANPKLKERLMQGLGLPTYLAKNKRVDYIERIVWASSPLFPPSSFKKLLEERAWKIRSTGIKHVLDHIIPLNHKYVCGLNVPYNVQVIPEKVNAAKSNKFHNGQSDFFTEPEQFKL